MIRAPNLSLRWITTVPEKGMLTRLDPPPQVVVFIKFWLAPTYEVGGSGQLLGSLYLGLFVSFLLQFQRVFHDAATRNRGLVRSVPKGNLDCAFMHLYYLFFTSACIEGEGLAPHIPVIRRRNRNAPQR